MKTTQETPMSIEERLAVIETTILHINTNMVDMKQDMYRNFDKIELRFAHTDHRIDSLTAKVDSLELKMDQKFDALENKFEQKLDAIEDKFDQKFVALEDKFDQKFATNDNKLTTLEQRVDSRFEAMQRQMWINFIWMMGGFIGLASLIAHTQHWI